MMIGGAGSNTLPILWSFNADKKNFANIHELCDGIRQKNAEMNSQKKNEYDEIRV
jgi:hypothetical protein